MAKYVIKRLLYSLLILFVVSLAIYGLVRCLPNDYIDLKFADKLAQKQITEEQILDIKKLYGLADNSFGGIIKGYFQWLGNALRGNLVCLSNSGCPLPK